MSINQRTRRPLTLDHLRTFEVVARHLSFRAAADELHLAQSAVSRRVQALEDELGTPVFIRDTRRVELTAAGELLRQAAQTAIERVDTTVQRIRAVNARQRVSVSTFASFATLWLLPRMAAFQDRHPDIDIRVATGDRMIALDDPEVDLVLRYAADGRRSRQHGERLFGERLSPIVSPLLMAQARSGDAPPLAKVADLRKHTLIEQEAAPPGGDSTGWPRWLREMGQPELEPTRWITLNFTHQLVQTAAAGRGVAMGRLPLIHDALERGELIEPFGPKGRLDAPLAYWLIALPGARLRPELNSFLEWVRDEAADTRRAMR